MVTFVQSYSHNRPFDGSHNVEVALSENEFDTPALDRILTLGSISGMCDKFWKELYTNKIQNMWQWLHNTGLNNNEGLIAQGQRLHFNYPYIYKL